jgi:hypothetical protein
MKGDDIERRLRQLTPRGAPPELRPRVLAAVAGQLHPAVRPSSRRSLHSAVALVAGVLASLALNVWVNHTLDRRLALVLGPQPPRRQAAEIAADVASITDSSTGQWTYEHLAAARPHDDDTQSYAVRLQQMIQQLTVDREETADETPETNSQMDRDRRGSRDHRPVDTQCLLRLEHWNTA